ncbi:hypothetical protein GCM10009799_38250 [Nocardiopsis rhodophaea]|uniref:Uncharacterized protein n=2 Tax=Nocardiopsis rhodophaea TaxID=280238 RepID=A0ABN2TEP6_9ACTN
MLLRISGSRPRAHCLLMLSAVVSMAFVLSIGGDSIATALLISLGTLAIAAGRGARLTPRLAAEGIG